MKFNLVDILPGNELDNDKKIPVDISQKNIENLFQKYKSAYQNCRHCQGMDIAGANKKHHHKLCQDITIDLFVAYLDFNKAISHKWDAGYPIAYTNYLKIADNIKKQGLEKWIYVDSNNYSISLNDINQYIYHEYKIESIDRNLDPDQKIKNIYVCINIDIEKMISALIECKDFKLLYNRDSKE